MRVVVCFTWFLLLDELFLELRLASLSMITVSGWDVVLLLGLVPPAADTASFLSTSATVGS